MTALEIKFDNVIQFPGTTQRRATSIYKSNGQPKPTAADPIRDPADIERIKQYFLDNNQRRNYTIFVLGIVFGIRAGDLLTLRVHHVLRPDGSFKPHCDLIESKTRKTNNPIITPEVQKVLSEWLAELTDYEYDDYLFRSRKRDINGNWQAMDVRSFNRILKKVSKDLDLNFHFSSHSLRKTFAYHLLERNPDNDDAKFALQRMLNHDSFKTTLAYCGREQDAIDEFRCDLAQTFI